MRFLRSERIKAVQLVLCSFMAATLASAQSAQIVWDTPEEIREWLAITNVPPGGVTGVDDLEEGARSFVRITYAEFNANMGMMIPGENYQFDALAELETVLDPEEHNAVTLVVRQSKLDSISGFWLHRDGEYDESTLSVPFFGLVEVAQEDAWTEVTLRLVDSPFLLSTSDVVAMGFTFSNSNARGRDPVAEWRALKEAGAVLDIDRIEFVQIPVGPFDAPLITDFAPKAAKRKEEVTIVGSGFAEPASRNAVFFGSGIVDIVSGSATELVVKPDGSGVVDVRVRTPGGLEALAADTFRFIGLARQVTIVSGDNQSAMVGSTLQPVRIKVADLSGGGVPGRNVAFRVTAGDGALSVTEGVTDDDGLVSTVLTLGQTPGIVRVEFAVTGFKPREVTATAVP